MRINLHVIVIGAGLTGSFFLKEMIAYLHMKQENLIRTDITVFDPGSIGKEDLGAVYIREDLGQNRALLLSELLKEQYDYEVTAVPGDFSVGSPVLQILFLWLIAAMGAFLETTERNGKNCLRKESCI